MSVDKWRTTYIHTSENPADILTTNLLAGENTYRKVRLRLFGIYPKDDGFEKTNNIEDAYFFNDCLEKSIICMRVYARLFEYSIPLI